MNDKDKKKGVTGIEKARKSSSIKQVESVEEVSKIGKVESVRGAGRAGAAAGLTPNIRYVDRDKLIGMVTEEAEKLFANSKLSADKKKIITEAVKMAIDSSLVPEEEEKGDSKE
ncbi:MAG: hypothetical protein KDD70_04395 [Bdellovibrionales bacterium]|nr:hypothetical protein [Bdellovibrionales bacterium]